MESAAFVANNNNVSLKRKPNVEPITAVTDQGSISAGAINTGGGCYLYHSKDSEPKCAHTISGLVACSPSFSFCHSGHHGRTECPRELALSRGHGSDEGTKTQ